MRGRPFEKGQGGRPKGARNHATLVAESMIGKCADALAVRALQLALEGDTTMLKFCLERLVPAGAAPSRSTSPRSGPPGT